MARNVLLPIDGSSNSQRAFDYYIENIRQPNDHVLLAHVQSVPNLSTFSINEPLSLPTEEWTQAIKQQIEESKKIMDNYEMLCEQKKIPKTPLLGQGGKPGEAIVEFAKKYDAKLIVVGSRGLNSIRRTFLGSVSDYIIHHSNVPVLVVPPEK